MNEMTVDEVVAARDACLARLGKKLTAARREGNMKVASHVAEDMAKLMLPPDHGTGRMVQDLSVQYALTAGDPERAQALVDSFCKAPGTGQERREELKALLSR